MINLEVNDVAILAQKKVLEQALSMNPKTQKALQSLIRKVIKEAREQAVGNIHLTHDPRGAVNSVRTSVYKKILGANINIYNSRRAGRPTSYEPPRKKRAPWARGGNRMQRSAATQRMMSYGPHDRGMVLRWINSGTTSRTSYGGNRGSISARNFFRNAAEGALQRAVDSLSMLIDKELSTIINQKK